MHERSAISWENNKALLHLYAFVDIATINDNNKKLEFMAKIDWPFNLMVDGEVYTLVSCGFWGGSHYWGKVLRHVNGITGVWMHNDLENDGLAQLVTWVPGSISGAQPKTSWVIYSCRWTPKENLYVDQSIANIARDNPRAGLDLPFSQMRVVLYSSYYTDRPSGARFHPVEADSSAAAENPNVDTDTRDTKLIARPAQEAAPPPEPRTTLKIRITLPKKTQVDNLPASEHLAVLPSTAPTSIMPKKRGRPRKQETSTAVCGPPVSAPDLSSTPLVPPPATAPARMDAGASAKRFRPIKKIPDNHRKGHIGDATEAIPAAPAPVGSVVNKKKEKTKEASLSVVKKPPTASDFQPRPLDDADWD
ncbi:hypothetical protein PTTG_01661 [Puccinia triticina 1-1 BBBD Race 1]|uniref:Uncharacterized protein n=1 Tax=Puccinia triticina (isolate 1-1 / race 1 (BBBD)) TaxID=630390 RepID=A0A180GMG1_PUCT1|nr:hypothetical protein PTTG_01661 [Puccinia triticina 1-1 BBBD Race 1]